VIIGEELLVSDFGGKAIQGDLAFP